MRAVTYSADEREIVKTGITAVQNVLMGVDIIAKERLLFCLDYYMDPYYKNKLPYETELIDLLQTVVVSPNEISVKEDALHLLTDYAYPPFPILVRHFDSIEKELIPDARYAITGECDDE